MITVRVRVSGLGFGACGLRFRVWGLCGRWVYEVCVVYRVSRAYYRCLRYRVHASVLRIEIPASGCRVDP